MVLQTESYPSLGFKQQQSYYNGNDFYSAEDKYNSNYSSSMQMTKPYGYPSVTTPQRTQHNMMMSQGGYSHDDDSWYNKDKYQTGYGYHNSQGQYGHMSHDSSNFSSDNSGYGSGMQLSSSHMDSGYGSGMQHSSSRMNGGYASGMQHSSSHMNGGYGSGMQHSSSHMNGGYGSGMQHSSHMNNGYGSGMQQSSYSHIPRGLGPTEHGSPKYYGQDSDRAPGYYEQYNKNTDMWNLKSLDD